MADKVKPCDDYVCEVVLGNASRTIRQICEDAKEFNDEQLSYIVGRASDLLNPCDQFTPDHSLAAYPIAVKLFFSLELDARKNRERWVKESRSLSWKWW